MGFNVASTEELDLSWGPKGNLKIVAIPNYMVN